MSPAEAVSAVLPKSDRRVWLTVGARRIDWGVVSASGRTSGCETLGSLDAVDPDQPASRQDMIAALASLPENWAAEHAATGLEVFVADRWLAVAVLPWSAALMSKECETYARTQLGQVGFDVSPNDTVRLDDAAYGKPRLAVAYPAELVAALKRAAGHWGVGLRSVLPVSAAAWKLAGDRLQAKLQALVLIDDDDIVIVGGDPPNPRKRTGRNVADLYARARDVSLPPLDDMRETWQRICLRQSQWGRLDSVVLLNGCANAGDLAGVPPPFVLPNIEGASSAPATAAVPVARLLAMRGKRGAIQAIDAMPPSHSVGLRTGVLLAIAVSVALFLAQRIAQTGEAIAAIGKEVEALSHPEPTQSGVPVWSREEANRVRAVNAAIRELNLPVSALLHSIAPPKDIRVAVLSVETSGEAATARSSLRLVAQTPSSAEMTRYVGFVAERKPFVGAYLVRHESIDDSGQRFIRFTVEAQWND